MALPTGLIHRRLLAGALLLSLTPPPTARGQTAKEIHEHTQLWVSLNTTARWSDKWGTVADVHIRRNDFIEDPSFYFLRFGAHRFLSDSLAVTLGYAHNWVAPAEESWHTWTQENRIYQQVQYTTRLGRVGLLHRVRNEQRWQQQVVDDALTGETLFSDRVRYLVSLTIPMSKKESVPFLVLSDEVLVQFGSDIVLNTFDQNRLFTGIKKRLGGDWSFDFGYMMVFQQKAQGYQYDLNHTLRVFFYWTPDRTEARAVHESAGNEE